MSGTWTTWENAGHGHRCHSPHSPGRLAGPLALCRLGIAFAAHFQKFGSASWRDDCVRGRADEQKHKALAATEGPAALGWRERASSCRGLGGDGVIEPLVRSPTSCEAWLFAHCDFNGHFKGQESQSFPSRALGTLHVIAPSPGPALGSPGIVCSASPCFPAHGALRSEGEGAGPGVGEGWGIEFVLPGAGLG